MLTGKNLYASTLILCCYGYQKKYPVKTTGLPQITDKLDHIMLYRVHLTMREIPIHNVLITLPYDHNDPLVIFY